MSDQPKKLPPLLYPRELGGRECLVMRASEVETWHEYELEALRIQLLAALSERDFYAECANFDIKGGAAVISHALEVRHAAETKLRAISEKLDDEAGYDPKVDDLIAALRAILTETPQSSQSQPARSADTPAKTSSTP